MNTIRMGNYQFDHCSLVVLYKLMLKSEPGVLVFEWPDSIGKTFYSCGFHFFFAKEPIVKNSRSKEQVVCEVDEVLVWNGVVTVWSWQNITSSVGTSGSSLMKWRLRMSVNLPMVLEDVGGDFGELKNNEYQLLVSNHLVTLISLSSIQGLSGSPMSEWPSSTEEVMLAASSLVVSAWETFSEILTVGSGGVRWMGITR